MENENKGKSIFEGFLQNLTFFYLLLIFLGYISTFLYYNIFGIPIFDYFSVEDFVNIFFKNLVYSVAISFILIICSLVLALIPMLIFYKGIIGDNETVSAKSEKWKKRTKIVIYISIVLLTICYIIRYLVFKDMKSQLALSLMILPIILGALMYFKDLFKKHKLAYISQSQHIIIFVGIILVYINYWIYYVDGVKLFMEENNKQKIVFHLNNNTITTSDSILFVGKSTDYLFFYNKKNKESIVYDKSLIEYIVINGKGK